jgi:hypothetical protein
MLGRKPPDKPVGAAPLQARGNGQANPRVTLLTIVGDHAKTEGTFEIAKSVQIECEVGAEPSGERTGVGPHQL